VSPTLNVNPSLFLIFCIIIVTIIIWGGYRSTMLQFFFYLQSSMTIFHHKVLTSEGRVLANDDLNHDNNHSLIHKEVSSEKLP